MVGWWVEEIKNIDHISPIETETGTELGNILISYHIEKQARLKSSISSGRIRIRGDTFKHNIILDNKSLNN